MNRDEIIRMAREADLLTTTEPNGYQVWIPENLERFAALVYAEGHKDGLDDFEAGVLPAAIKAEREACAAQVGQQWTTFEELKAAHYRHSPEPFDPFRFHKDLSTIFFSRDMAYAIRARGQE